MLIVLKETSKDWLLVILVAMLSLGANLPDKFAQFIYLDKKYFLTVLIAVIGIALLRYLKFTLILVIAILALGSNMPADLAKEFGIDTDVMLVSLVMMVAISLANKVLKLSTGLDRSGREKSTKGAALLLQAILKGRTPVVQSLLQAGVNANIQTVDGKTPLMAAAFKGYTDIILMLLSHGADINLKDTRGNTAATYAERAGNQRAVEILQRATA